MPDKVNQIAFKGTLEYRKWLKQHALDRGIGVQKLLEDAVGAYLAEPATRHVQPLHHTVHSLPSDSYSDEERELIGALLRFLHDDTVPAPLRKVLDTLLNEWRGPSSKTNNKPKSA